MTVLWLYILAVVDGTFVGCRDVIGQIPLLEKRRKHLRSYLWGAALAHVALLVMGAVIFGALSLWPEIRAELTVVADRMLLIYGVYAVCVAVTFALYAIPIPDVRGFVTLAIFGVLTLVRVPVIILGGAWASSVATRAETWGVVAVVLLTMTSLSRVLSWLGVNDFDWSFALEDT